MEKPTRTCDLDGCDGRHKARGLCLRHYQLTWASENRPKVNEYKRKAIAKRPDHYRAQDSARRREQWPEWYAEHRDEVLARAARYRASNPEANHARVTRWAESHREQLRAKSREYARAHPEKRVQIQARRRARKRGNGQFLVTERDIRRLLMRCESRCLYCRAPLGTSFHLDHIVPLARGGHHAIGNLAPACADCNLTKGSMTLTEWRKRHQPA